MPWGSRDRGQTVSLINKLNAMLGRHVLRQGGELRVGPEPAAGQIYAGSESWEHCMMGGGGSRTGEMGQQGPKPSCCRQAERSGALAWEACKMMCLEMGVGTRCWMQELELVVTWTGTIVVSRTEWIHKGSSCGPVCGRKMETPRKCYQEKFKELLRCTWLGPVPLLSLKKSLLSLP